VAGPDDHALQRPELSVDGIRVEFSPTPDLTAELERVLAERAVTPLFQPIVELRTGQPLGFESLARGPQGSPLQFPDRLFGTARATGRLAQLDRLCQHRALETALSSGLGAPFGLFVNVEPAAVGPIGLPESLLAALRERGLRLVIELTERALTADPARLLALADWARSLGWGVALDDVGADPASLALMPFLRPDIVKLDLRLVQQRPDEAVAEIMTAVTAYAEASGAKVLAEGIETPEHAALARGLGATLGQGWLFGRPAPLPEQVDAPERPLVLSGGDAEPLVRSPYAAAARQRPPQRGPKSLLIAVSKLLERQAAELGNLAVVLAAFEEERFFTPASGRRYRDLAERVSFVGALGAGLPGEPVPGVRGAHLAPEDPVVGEWDIAVVGPHFAAALVARDLGDEGTDADRTFDYVLTYDRELVLEVARSLMSRLLPQPTTPHLAAPSVPAQARPVEPAPLHG
jgi:EAL domain-containing protein (putative c-di-GMP-specific phosphodiesterase class I)/DICT domain-containing protein